MNSHNKHLVSCLNTNKDFFQNTFITKGIFSIILILEIMQYATYLFVPTWNIFSSILLQLFLLYILIKLWLQFKKGHYSLKYIVIICFEYNILSIILAIPFFVISLILHHALFLEMLVSPLQFNSIFLLFILSGYLTRTVQ